MSNSTKMIELVKTTVLTCTSWRLILNQATISTSHLCHKGNLPLLSRSRICLLSVVMATLQGTWVRTSKWYMAMQMTICRKFSAISPTPTTIFAISSTSNNTVPQLLSNLWAKNCSSHNNSTRQACSSSNSQLSNSSNKEHLWVTCTTMDSSMSHSSSTFWSEWINVTVTKDLLYRTNTVAQVPSERQAVSSHKECS